MLILNFEIFHVPQVVNRCAKGLVKLTSWEKGDKNNKQELAMKGAQRKKKITSLVFESTKTLCFSQFCFRLSKGAFINDVILWGKGDDAFVWYILQRCPTLSPFATCGDRRFKCGDRQLLRNGYLLVNTQCFSYFLTKVATAKFLSPHLWQMWRQEEFGWTPLF